MAEEIEPRVGDITIIPYPRVREQLGCSPEAGILMEDRRNVVRVFFPTMDRTFWLDRDKVAVVAPGRLAVHPLVERLHRIATLVNADLIEMGDDEEDPGVVQVYTRGTDLDNLLAVRDLVADDLVAFRIEAGSVRRAKLKLRFR